ncbi:Uncharacterised protein [uncultured archaeon]|nr:Uncharacterised protein [uncultured archaeon]
MPILEEDIVTKGLPWPMVFLSRNEAITLDTPEPPCPPDRVSFRGDLGVGPAGSTEVLDFLGLDIVNVQTPNYHLIASASKYLVSMIPWNGKDHWFSKEERDSRTPEQRVLFDGGIAIYRVGSIPSSQGIKPNKEVRGSYHERNGRIWLSRKDLIENPDLSLVLFANSTADDEKERRVEMILRAYEHQDMLRSDARHRAIYGEYARGRKDQIESDFGTFGHHHPGFPDCLSE